MQSFEYANPATLKEAFAALGNSWDDAAVLAGGTPQFRALEAHPRAGGNRYAVLFVRLPH